VLGAIALAGLKPWATTSVSPNLSLSPGLGLALGDAEAVAKAPSVDIADSHVAGGGSAAVASKPVAYGPAHPDSRVSVGVSQGRPVQVSESTPTSPSPAAIKPVAAPPGVVPEPPSPPASSAPVLAGIDEGAQNSPVTAGVEEDGDVLGQSCEGDHYTVPISYGIDEATGERLPTEILVQRIEGDESVSELRVEGDLADYRDLIAALVADGGCVEVEYEPVSEGEDAGEASESGVEAGAPGDTLEPATP
jgi:hypothetical protein